MHQDIYAQTLNCFTNFNSPEKEKKCTELNIYSFTNFSIVVFLWSSTFTKYIPADNWLTLKEKLLFAVTACCKTFPFKSKIEIVFGDDDKC